MVDESFKRKNLVFTDINSLSQEIKKPYNDFIVGEQGFSRYRMDYIFKKYAGLNENYKIHALLEHGIIFTDYVGGAFRNHEYLPSVVASKYRVDVLKSKEEYIKAYSVGPFIHYADYLLDGDQLKAEKERLGHSLLVFPTHSLEGIVSSFDFQEFIDKINKISKRYDSVRVCMYYKDVLLNKHIPYEKAGFEVVTAGHFNDSNFLPRLKCIIESSSMTVSNDISTHIGYCLYLNKPHFLIQTNVKFCDEKNSNHIAQDTREHQGFGIDNYGKIAEAFSEFDETITSSQKDIVNYLWGFDEVKTPNELKNMFTEINKNFSYLKYYFSGLIRFKNILKGNRR